MKLDAITKFHLVSGTVRLTIGLPSPTLVLLDSHNMAEAMLLENC